MVTVGDKVRFVPSGDTVGPDTEKRRAVTGTVTYVNQAHRHYGVIAELGDGDRRHTIRESFKF